MDIAHLEHKHGRRRGQLAAGLVAGLVAAALVLGWLTGEQLLAALLTGAVESAAGYLLAAPEPPSDAGDDVPDVGPDDGAGGR